MKKKLNHIKLILLLSFLSLISCDALKRIASDALDVVTNIGNDANQTLDQAINDLNGNAANYADIMQEAINKIDNQEIKNQLENALDAANHIVASSGTEIRCSIQFTADYLIKRLNSIKASILGTPIPEVEPEICNVTPSVIDMNRPVNQRNSIAITGYFMNENFRAYQLYLYNLNGSSQNKTSSLSVSSDFKLIINLGNNGITLSDQSQKLVLKWKTFVLTEIPIIQAEPEPCNIRDRTLNNLPSLVVYPDHEICPWNNKKGDLEFNGNGPCTTGHVSLFTRNAGRELWARARVLMWECPDDITKYKHDYTYGSKTKEIKLRTVDHGWKIKSINVSTFDQFQDIDKHPDRTYSLAGGGPVLNYLINGDFYGDDLGKSRVEISFKTIRVTLEEIGACISN